jgi:phosphoribosyl 1,2-cyclic phosphodiesterase
MTITYWGATGTLAVPLRPVDVTGKIVDVIDKLVEAGQLADLPTGPNRLAELQRRIEAVAPFHLRSTFGGNTTCLEVQTADGLIILDSGTGFRELGWSLQERWNSPDYRGPRTGHVLISHPHFDHTMATAFFAPYYDRRNRFILWGTQSVIDSYNAVLNPQSPMAQTYFPPTYEMLTGLGEWRAIDAGADFAIGATRIRTYALHHPGGCLAYRLESAGRVFVFATDHEHQEVPDRGLADFAHGADLLYTEGQYLQAEYEGKQAIPGDPLIPRVGWGHSPVEACVATALAAHVKQLHIGHREPRRSDSQLADIEGRAQRLMCEELRRTGRAADDCLVLIPYEGLTVCL